MPNLHYATFFLMLLPKLDLPSSDGKNHRCTALVRALQRWRSMGKLYLENITHSKYQLHIFHPR